MPLLPYWRLSGFYFFYFSLVGAFSPYWSLYLQSLEFNALQIGVLMSLSLIVRIFSPSIWGWLADHTGKRIRVVQIAALCGFLCFCGFLLGESFIWIFFVMLLIEFLLECFTAAHGSNYAFAFGRSTPINMGAFVLGGLLGFVLTVIGVGYLLENESLLLWLIMDCSWT
jgi:PPP family 3-phenylpropionic acid transporter